MVDSNDRERIQEGAAVLQKMVSINFKLIIFNMCSFENCQWLHILEVEINLGNYIVSRVLRMHRKAFCSPGSCVTVNLDFLCKCSHLVNLDFM